MKTPFFRSMVAACLGLLTHVALGQSAPKATLTALPTGYSLTGGTVTLTGTVSYSVVPTSLAADITLPSGWTYVSGLTQPTLTSGANQTQIVSVRKKSDFGVTSTNFVLTVRYPAGEPGARVVSLAVTYTSGTVNTKLPAVGVTLHFHVESRL